MDPEPPTTASPQFMMTCGHCGHRPPAPPYTPTAHATACGQCGGPAYPGAPTVAVTDRFGTPRAWRICLPCTCAGVGPLADAAVLADMLGALLPSQHDLVATAFRVAVDAPPPSAQPVEIGWTVFARRIDGLGPYHRVKPGAAPDDAPGPRWWFIVPAVVGAVVEAVERADYLRTPVRALSGKPCLMCGNEEGWPGRWYEHVPGRPVCGTCRDLISGSDAPPPRAPFAVPDEPCAACAPPPEQVAPEPVAPLVVCGQCGGPAPQGLRTVPVHDRYSNVHHWSICEPCNAASMAPNPDAAVLVDVVQCRMGSTPQVAALAQALCDTPPPASSGAPAVGWSAFAQRIDGLGPYHRVRPGAQTTDPYGYRWGHLFGESVRRIFEDLETAHYMRTPQPHPSGLPCAGCQATAEYPARWSERVPGRPLCARCTDDAQAAAYAVQEDALGVRRMMSG